MGVDAGETKTVEIEAELEDIKFYNPQNESWELDSSYTVYIGTSSKDIIEAGKELNKPVVATSDAHYVDPNQKIFRDVYIRSQAIGGKHHPLYDFKGRIKDNPDQHLRTTQEMLEEFSFLDKDLAKEIVVTNSNLVADMIEPVIPLKDGTYSPRMENDKEELTRICWETAHKIYGENMPDIVKQRIEKELNSIIGNGFAVMYYIAHKLVKKSNDDGYYVKVDNVEGQIVYKMEQGEDKIIKIHSNNNSMYHYITLYENNNNFYDNKYIYNEIGKKSIVIR